MTMETELSVRRQPAEMIALAVAKGRDLEKLKGLLDLQERWEANEAKKAYNRAMSDFKANPPSIKKDRKVVIRHKDNVGVTKYNHASLWNVVLKITEALSKHGLSASWRTKQEGKICVTCKITHELGHSEETTLCADPDATGSKNSIQAIGSTISYLERYTLLALTGLATHDQDDDAVTVEPEKKGEIIEMPVACKVDSTTQATAAQKQHLKNLALSLGQNTHVTQIEFLKKLGMTNIDTLTINQFSALVKRLGQKIDEENKKRFRV
jgi:hypothetical protein